MTTTTRKEDPIPGAGPLDGEPNTPHWTRLVLESDDILAAAAVALRLAESFVGMYAGGVPRDLSGEWDRLLANPKGSAAVIRRKRLEAELEVAERMDDAAPHDGGPAFVHRWLCHPDRDCSDGCDTPADPERLAIYQGAPDRLPAGAESAAEVRHLDRLTQGTPEVAEALVRMSRRGAILADLVRQVTTLDAGCPGRDVWSALRAAARRMSEDTLQTDAWSSHLAASSAESVAAEDAALEAFESTFRPAV